LTLALNYTYTDAEEENKAYTVQDYGFPPFFPPNFQYDWVKRRAAFTPKDQFKANLTWRSDFGLTAQLIGRFVGSRCWYRTETTVYPNTETERYKLERYWTADVKLEQRLYDHWLLSFEATNIFDKHYDTYYGTFTNQQTGVTSVAPYPGAGTTVFFKLRYEY
jgi:iron complex outermembrane receptor protein